jgi:hypothetical protein
MNPMDKPKWHAIAGQRKDLITQLDAADSPCSVQAGFTLP